MFDTYMILLFLGKQKFAMILINFHQIESKKF